MPQTLLIATNNEGKISELRDLLSGLPFELVSLNEFESITEVAETGATFRENAALKAVGYARLTGLPSIADDSGLAVDALGGRPGVLSARYGGDHLDFAGKMELLLDELKVAADPVRTARFVCSIVVAGADGAILSTADGVCEGHIAEFPRGLGGFGYDPLFIPNGFDQTFGELAGDVKRRISHRARAFQQIIPFLRHFTAV